MSKYQLDRLQSQLLTSGLQVKDNPLYQVIDQLIQAVAKANLDINKILSKPSTITVVQGTQGSPGFDGIDGLDGVDGEIGLQGLQGLFGPQGPSGIDGESEEPAFFIAGIEQSNLINLTFPLAVSKGGTGIASFAVGDLIYGSATNVLTALADVATGNALISGGVLTAPSWGKIGLTTHISGILALGNGGTGATAFTAGSIVFSNGTILTQDNSNLFWDDTNNRLGIGTATPGNALDLQGAGNTKIFNISTSSVGTGYLFIGIVNTGGSLAIGVENSIGNTFATNALAFSSNIATLNTTAIHLSPNQVVALTAINGGKVGIGTTAPANLLHVYGTTSLDGIQIDGTVNPNLTLANAGIIKARIAIPTSANAFLTGSAISDLILRTEGANKILLGTNSVAALTIDSSQQVGIGTVTPGAIMDVAGSFQCDTITNDTGLAHGTYTPTLTGVTNIDTVTAIECQYLRVGNTVTVSGNATFDATTAGATTRVGISLPVVSNIGAVEDCVGTAVETGIATFGVIQGDAVNNRAQLTCLAVSAAGETWAFTFTYQVI